jgi:pyridoxal phosphate enzyme (YggS family)
MGRVTLAAVRAGVDAASARAGRPSSAVTIVAVSKGRSVEEIIALYEAGHRDFGENRAGELAAKVGSLPRDIRWHFVGHLQSNKARVVRPTGAILHSLDGLSLAKAWLKGPGSPPPCLLQVNIGRESQKSGAAPEAAVEVAREISEIGIELTGVMAILPIGTTSDAARPFFRHLSALRAEISDAVPSVRELSMGMTDDYDVAVEEGATLIRVGRAIFDADQSPG